jgi:hypothetical protein
MHIVAHGFQITIATAIDWKGLIAAAKEVAEKLAPPVKSGGVHSQEPFHALHQIGIWSFKDQMEVVKHETKAVNLPGSFPAGLLQGRKEQQANSRRSSSSVKMASLWSPRFMAW